MLIFKDMLNKERYNYAFIDIQNVYLGIKNQGWKIDFSKFHTYLKDKFHIKKSFIFIGYVEDNKKIYKKLEEDGYVLIFKQSLTYGDGLTKGNCDAELVLHAMIEYQNYNKAVIVSGDGDFFCLAEYLRDNNKLEAVLVPDQKRYSALLKKINTVADKFIIFLDEARNKLEYTHKKKKAI